MRGAQAGRPRRARPKLALACAAAALACALCLPAALRPGMTAGGGAADGAAQSAAAFAAEAPGTAQPETAQARGASPDAAAPKLASAGGAADSAAGSQRPRSGATRRRGLSQEALPAQLPLYADGADGTSSAEAQLQALLDGAPGAQNWTYTAYGAAVTAAAADGGALLARPAGTEDGGLCEAYAQALSARRAWQADGGEYYALAGEDAGVPAQLYAYRFERLGLDLGRGGEPCGRHLARRA